MNKPEFEREMGKAKTFKGLEEWRQEYWLGYIHGLRRGYHGERFCSEEEHKRWWEMADDDVDSKRERGEGYRAGFRCANLGCGYCSQNSFSCEICSLVNYGRDCHNTPI
jgi:hypothetical protein